MTSRRRAIAARKRTRQTGSPIVDEPVFLLVGRLRRPHGVNGEIVMSVFTDFPERIKPKTVVYIGYEHRPTAIRSVRWNDKDMLIRLEGVAGREDAGRLRNEDVFVRADDRPALPKGQYYHHQIIGLKVITDTGEELGMVSEILETGANSVYVVRREAGGEALLPVTTEVILGVDLEKKVLRVHLLEGLLEDK